MHPFYFWLFPAWPWLVAAESVRVASLALAPQRGTAEIIPFPERRIHRRVARAAG